MDMEQRPLYAPLREGKDFAVWPMHRAHAGCSGACDQGRRPCTSPDACFVSDEPEDMHAGMGVIVVPVLILSAAAVSAVILAAFGWL